ncbi:Intersectin-2 [Rhizophlyctis rosea]|nr:Intersectin-2 [Rhizophlyctis rosea]
MSLRVVAAHQAGDTEELELEVGDIIELDTLPANVEEYWWHGVNRAWGPNNGQVGFFPKDCVEMENWEPPPPEPQIETSPSPHVVEDTSDHVSDTGNGGADEDVAEEELEIPKPVPPGTQVTVIMEYEMMKADEIDLKVGETVVVTSAPEGGWWRGTKDLGGKNPKQGWFPATHVKVETDDDAISVKSGPAQTESSPFASVGQSMGSFVGDSTTSLNEGPGKRKSWFKRMVPKKGAEGMKGKRSRSLSAPLPHVGLNSTTQGKSLSALPDASETSLTGGPSAESLTRPSVACSMREDRDYCEEMIDFTQSEGQHKRSHSAPAVSLSDLRQLQVEREPSIPARTSTIMTPEVLPSIPTPVEPAVRTRPSSTVEVIRPKSIAEDISKSWQDRVSKETLEMMSARDKKRTTAIWELIETERDYVRDLVIIIETFMKPLADRKILTQKQIEVLFMNVPQLHKINEKFLSRLEAKWSEAEVPDSIGDVLMDGVEHFVSYTVYCGNQTASVAKMNSWKENKKEFRAFLDDTHRNPITRNLDLGGFLIKPVQRICKYPLLIKEIMKYTEETNPDHAQLKAALDRVQGVISIVNEGARQVEGVRNIASIQANFTERLNIATPTRHFVREDAVWIHFDGFKKPRRLFVFNDLLILARKDWRDKYHLIDKAALRDVRMADVSDDAGSNLTNYMELEIVPTDGGQSPDRYLLSTQTQQAKQSWLDTYRNLTQLAVRTKLLSETNSSSSAQMHSDNEDDSGGRRRRRQSTTEAAASAKELEQVRAELVAAEKRSVVLEEKWKAEKDELEAKMNELRNSLQSTESREAALVGKLRSREIEMELKVSELEMEGKNMLNRKQEDMDAKVIELELKMANKLRESDESKAEVQKSLEEGRDRMAVVEQALATVRKQAAALGTEVKELSGANEALSKRGESLSAELGASKARVEILQKELVDQELGWSERYTRREHELAEELSAKHATIVKDLQSSHAKAVGELETNHAEEVRSLQAEISSLRQKSGAEVDSLRQEGEEKLRTLRQDADEKINTIRRDADEKIRATREEAEQKLGRQRQEADAKLAAHIEEFNQRLAQQKEESLERGHALQAASAREQEKSAQIQRLTMELESVRSSSKESNENLKQALSEAQSQLREREAVMRAREDALRERDVENRKLELDRNQHVNEIARLRASAEASKTEYENVRKSLEKALDERQQMISKKDWEINELSRKVAESVGQVKALEMEMSHLKEELAHRRKSGDEINARQTEEIMHLRGQQAKLEQTARALEQRNGELNQQLERGKVHLTQVSEANRQLATDLARAKDTAAKQATQRDELSRDHNDVKRRLAEVQETLQKRTHEVHELETLQRSLKEQLSQKSAEGHQATLKAERLEGQTNALERARAAMERELDESRQNLQREISSLRARLEESEEESRIRSEKERESLRSRLLEEAREDQARLVAENEELREKLQKESAELREKKETESATFRNRMEVIERLEKETAAGKERAEKEIEILKTQIERLEEEFRERSKTSSQLKRRVRQLETENTQLTDRLKDVTSAAETAEAESRQLESHLRSAQDEITQTRTRLSAAETEHGALQHRIQLYNEMDRKYVDLRVESSKIAQTARDYEQELRRAHLMHAKRARDLAALQMVFAEVAKAVALPLSVGIDYSTMHNGPMALQRSSSNLLDAAAAAASSSPLEDGRLVAVLTKINDLISENDHLRGELGLERAKMEELVEAERLAKGESMTIAEAMKKLENRLKHAAKKHKLETERNYSESTDLKVELDNMQKRLAMAERMTKEAEERTTTALTEKRQMERQFMELYERLQKVQCHHLVESNRLNGQVASLSKETQMLAAGKADAMQRMEQLSASLRSAQHEISRLQQLNDALNAGKEEMQGVVDSTDGTVRALNVRLKQSHDEMTGLRDELTELRNWQEEANKKLNSQKKALERNVIEMATAGEELQRRTAEVQTLRQHAKERESLLSQALNDSHEHTASLQVELVQARGRETGLRRQVEQIAGDLQWEQIQRERLEKERSVLEGERDKLQKEADRLEKGGMQLRSQIMALHAKLQTLQSHIVNSAKQVHLSKSALLPSAQSLISTSVDNVQNIISGSSHNSLSDDRPIVPRTTSIQLQKSMATVPEIDILNPDNLDAQLSHLTILIRSTETLLTSALQTLQKPPPRTSPPSSRSIPKPSIAPSTSAEIPLPPTTTKSTPTTSDPKMKHTASSDALRYMVANAREESAWMHNQESIGEFLRQALENLSTARDLLQHLEDSPPVEAVRRRSGIGGEVGSAEFRRVESDVGETLDGEGSQGIGINVGGRLGGGWVRTEDNGLMRSGEGAESGNSSYSHSKQFRLASVKLGEMVGQGLGKSIESELNRRSLVANSDEEGRVL